MRALQVLSTTFGLALGVAACAVATLIDWATAEPVRVNFGFVGDDDTGFATSGAVALQGLSTAIAICLAGALLGWLAGFLATRRGWELSRPRRS